VLYLVCWRFVLFSSERCPAAMTCRHTCVHARATHARPHLCDACACTRKHSNGRRVLSTSEKGTVCADMVPQLLDKLDSSKSAQVHDNVSGALIWFLSQHGQMHWYVPCTRHAICKGSMPSVVRGHVTNSVNTEFGSDAQFSADAIDLCTGCPHRHCVGRRWQNDCWSRTWWRRSSTSAW